MVRGTLFSLAKLPTVATQPSLRRRIPVRIRSCPATVCHSPVTSPTWFEKRYTEILEEDATK